MPVIGGHDFTQHGYERFQERGLTIDDLEWALNGNSTAIEDGKTMYQRWYTDNAGYRWGIFVIVSGTGRIVTVWVREG